MTAGPSAGPASAYPMFRTPASICFSAANEVCAPGLVAGSCACFALACASADPIMPDCAAAMAPAATPKKRRRRGLISWDISISLVRRKALRPGSGRQCYFNDFVLDTNRCELRCGTRLVAVEPQVFDLLEFLIRVRGNELAGLLGEILQDRAGLEQAERPTAA